MLKGDSVSHFENFLGLIQFFMITLGGVKTGIGSVVKIVITLQIL